MRKDHWAVYGNLKLLRVWCDDCESYCLVIRGVLLCCDRAYISPSGDRPTKRMTEPYEAQRKNPGKRSQDLMLQAQDYRCFWCDQRFGDFVRLKGRDRQLKVHWDHKVPFAYSADNSERNFVASCHVCNIWKRAMMFNTIEECRLYLHSMWAERVAEVSSAVEEE